MSIAMAYWVLMFVWLGVGGLSAYRSGGWQAWGGNFLVFILLVLLGWHVFGAPIRG